MKAPRDYGKAAYASGINAPALDAEFMGWLRQHTSGEVGSAIRPMEEWLAGMRPKSGTCSTNTLTSIPKCRDYCSPGFLLKNLAVDWR